MLSACLWINILCVYFSVLQKYPKFTTVRLFGAYKLFCILSLWIHFTSLDFTYKLRNKLYMVCVHWHTQCDVIRGTLPFPGISASVIPSSHINCPTKFQYNKSAFHIFYEITQTLNGLFYYSWDLLLVRLQYIFVSKLAPCNCMQSRHK